MRIRAALACLACLLPLACAVDAQPESEAGADSASAGLVCEEGGEAGIELLITVPPLDPPANAESDQDRRSASCVVDSVLSDANQTTFGLVCDEQGGPSDQPYELMFRAPEGESFVLEQGTELELELDLWWGFEVGSGRRVALRVDGQLVLLAYTESAAQIGDCDQPNNGQRIEAQQWLDPLGGELVAAACEPAQSYAASFDDALVFPGQVGELEGGLRFVLEASSCDGPGQNSAGTWRSRFAAWAP